MKAFIRGIGNISPQPTFEKEVFPEGIREYHTAKLQSVEPDYKNFIKSAQLRRMGRLLKMGVTSAGMCLQDAGIEKPDSIITATGLGMQGETEKFLNSLLDNGEEMLNPTAFMQSTHNTVGAHIAVMLGCKNYNVTYVHGPVSFEHALLDSLMWLAEKPSDKVLLGGIEEITELYFDMTDSLGFWKKGEISNLELLEDKRPGTIAGEGAAFFLLTTEENHGNYACIRGLTTRFNPGNQDIALSMVQEFLESKNISVKDIDLLLLGMNGDPASDAVYQPVLDNYSILCTAWFKHLCGEHYLASSFALWLAAKILKNGNIPAAVMLNDRPKSGRVNNILIYNHYRNIYHALILLSSC
ncbi:MAG TPA: beta-ketoacyl synthase chain length factor [Bacteroidales bacterium]|nr:beta-ketoacyl synthase chain length factor [Bacteroidales bacterium]HNS46105.1 beta-ketoacyl synthase chain length factor [Bacteroidales bacterium]